jgi:hypothetical protein
METVKVYKNKDIIGDNGEYAELPKLRNDFIAKLENSLMFLSYKCSNVYHAENINQISLNQFDGAWLIDVSLRHEDKEGFVFTPFTDLQVTPEMFPNLNLKTLNLSGDVAFLDKHRMLTPQEKRHLDRYKYIYSRKFSWLDYGKQKWWGMEDGYGFSKMSKHGDFNAIIPEKTSLKPGYTLNKVDVEREILEGLKDTESQYFHTIKSLHMAYQLSLTYYYEWSCYIKEDENSIGIRIPIHPSSSKEIFIMRNINKGDSRKKAICNYVKDHYRTIKGNGNEREALIKQHFRGELKFNWRGLEVHITPSEYDLKRIKTSKNFNRI